MPAPNSQPPAPPPSGHDTGVEGIVERVTFANEENGFSVLRRAVASRREPVAAAGTLLGGLASR